MLKINCIKQQRKKKLLLDITSISKLVPRKRQDGATSSSINSSFDSNRKLLECGHLCSTWMHLINNNKKTQYFCVCLMCHLQIRAMYGKTGWFYSLVGVPVHLYLKARFRCRKMQSSKTCLQWARIHTKIIWGVRLLWFVQYADII